MYNRNKPAFPVPCTINENGIYTTMSSVDGGNDLVGFSKREYFAAMAMQGLLSNSVTYQGHSSESEIAAQAVWMADALLTQLEKL
jgi:hypothetical protein